MRPSDPDPGAASAPSVHARLLDLAAHRGMPVDRVLERYIMERFLYRLTLSDLRPEFVLKGAMLLAAWPGATARVTEGLDLLASGSGDPAGVARRVGRVLDMPVAGDDGVHFDAASVSAEVVRGDGARAADVRVLVRASVDHARVPLRLGVSFGDVVTPGPVDLTFPVLLDHRAPRVLAYTLESVIAEKLETLCRRDSDAPRVQDYYDLWMLADDFEFDAGLLGRAVRATLRARGTRIDASGPPGLSPDFFRDRDHQRTWEAFLHRSGIVGPPHDLPTLGKALRLFLVPLLESITSGSDLKGVWGRGEWR